MTWASDDASAVTVSASGLVTAVANGTATITATAGSASGSATVTVAQEVGTVAVTPEAGTVVAGDTLRLTAEAADANGHPVAVTEFEWASSDTLVAVVDGAGLVTGVGAGQAEVAATAAGMTGRTEITVVPQVENPDRAALVELYNATDGSNWSNSDNWLTDLPLGEWYGVDTDVSGRVERLDLRGRRDEVTGELIPHGLTGAIPSQIGRLGNLAELSLSQNRLSAPIPPEIGNLRELRRLTLDHNDLTDSIPSELGNLANLSSLNLGNNNLTGPLPPELADLSNLTELTLLWNKLSGPIPRELLQLRQLRLLEIQSTNLCVPGVASFHRWVEGIEIHDVGDPSFCNAADIAALEALHDATGGSVWIASDGWLTDRDLENWHGVGADSLGRVTGLDLTRNGLNGQLPSDLGGLTRMTLLRIGGNDLSGRLPSSLTNLSLTELHYAGTRLCAPADGGELFSLSFATAEVADGDGSSGFAFALPVEAAWEATLGTITLSGPEGSVTLDGDGNIPMAILRNPRTGQVRGFLRDLPSSPLAAMSGGPSRALRLEVLFSRGVPDAEAWRR